MTAPAPCRKHPSYMQLHLMTAADGEKRQMTNLTGSFAGVNVQPNRDAFSFMRDTGGNEVFQQFYHDFNSGETMQLSDGVGRYGSFTWSRKGDMYAFVRTTTSGKAHTDMHIRRLRKKPEPLLTGADRVWEPALLS